MTTVPTVRWLIAFCVAGVLFLSACTPSSDVPADRVGKYTIIAQDVKVRPGRTVATAVAVPDPSLPFDHLGYTAMAAAEKVAQDARARWVRVDFILMEACRGQGFALAQAIHSRDGKDMVGANAAPRWQVKTCTPECWPQDANDRRMARFFCETRGSDSPFRKRSGALDEAKWRRHMRDTLGLTNAEWRRKSAKIGCNPNVDFTPK